MNDDRVVISVPAESRHLYEQAITVIGWDVAVVVQPAPVVMGGLAARRFAGDPEEVREWDAVERGRRTLEAIKAHVNRDQREYWREAQRRHRGQKP